jgi:thiamine-monophosphate kinase
MTNEFEFIDRMKSKYGLSLIGDDCAVLPKDDHSDLVITADMLVEDIDFRLNWATPEQIGHKALAVSLSDIAAMGGNPKWAMLSMGVSEKLWKTDFLDRFYSGWHALAGQFGVELIGGDISRTPEHSVIDSIVGGEVPKGQAILRSGAKPGNLIYVSGELGGAAAGLKLLEESISNAELIKKQLYVSPQVELGKRLSEQHLASSMIDLSDGLSSDLMHICNASGVGAVLYVRAIPVDPRIVDHFPAGDASYMALNGGEDFQLLFTTSGSIEIDGVTLIGHITKDAGAMYLEEDDATRVTVVPGGFRHF